MFNFPISTIFYFECFSYCFCINCLFGHNNIIKLNHLQSYVFGESEKTRVYPQQAHELGSPIP